MKALGRPSVSAWAVNQLYWQDRGRFEALLDAGEQFRQAQQAQLAGNDADLIGALDRRREAVAALTRSAARILHQGGHNPTADTMRRVTTTLEALATYGRSAEAPAHGRLMADVPPPGFEALAALVPRVSGSTSPGHGSHRVLAFTERTSDTAGRQPTRDLRSKERDAAARRASAVSAARVAARDLAAAQRAAAKARDRMKASAGKATALERAASVAAARSEKASVVADAARRAARKAAADAETAVQALQDAELALERARDRVRAFED